MNRPVRIPKLDLKLLSIGLLALGILSCDVQDRSTATRPESFVTLAPRLLKADGSKVDSVDSVRLEVSFGGQSMIRSVSFREHGFRLDSIPANTPWTLTVKGIRKAADGLHWPVWWEGSQSGDGSGSATVSLDTVLIFSRDTVPPDLSASGLPAQDLPTLPYGQTLDTLQFHFPMTDTVYCGSALHPGQTTGGISYYTFVFAVPDTFVITVVDSAMNVALDTFRFTVSTRPQDTTEADTTTPTIVFSRITVDTAARKAYVQASVTSGPSGIDSVVASTGPHPHKRLASPYEDTIPLTPGDNFFTDSVYAGNRRRAAVTDTVTLPRTGPSSPPQVTLQSPTANPDTVDWSTKSVNLIWTVGESPFAVEEVRLNGAPQTRTGATLWGGVRQLSPGLNKFTLWAKNSNGDTASHSALIFRRLDTIHPTVTWQGPTASGDTLAFKTLSYIATWKVSDLDTLTAVAVNGKSLVGSPINATDFLFSDTLALRKSSLGYDTSLSLLATGGEPEDTTRSTVILHVQGDTSRPVIVGSDSALVEYGTPAYKASWTVTDLDTVVSVTAEATANGQPVAGTLVHNGNVWTDSFSLASSPVTVVLTARDSAGNISTRNFKVRVAAQSGDHLPPSIDRTSPVVHQPHHPDTVSFETRTATFSWTITDNGEVGLVTHRGKTLTSVGNGVWKDTQAIQAGLLDTFILSASDTSGNTSSDTTVFFRRPDTASPGLERATGTDNKILPSSVESYQAAWIVTDASLRSVTINDNPVGSTSSLHSFDVPLTGDSLWVKIVAVDSFQHLSTDSIKIRRLKPPTIRPGSMVVTASTGATSTFGSNLPGAHFQYSTDKSSWTDGDTTVVDKSEILYVRAILDGTTSGVDSATYLYPPVVPASGGRADSSNILVSAAGSPPLSWSYSSAGPWQSTSTGSIQLVRSGTILVRSSLGDLTSTTSATYALAPQVTPASGSFESPFRIIASAPGAESVQFSLDTADNWSSTFDPAGYTISENDTVYARSIVGTYKSPTVVRTYWFPHDTSLASLKVNGKEVTHRDANGDYYTDSLPAPTSQVTIQALARSSNASITIGSSTGAGDTVTATASLSSTTKIVAISVSNGTSANTYSLKIVRKQSPPPLYDARDDQSYRTTRIGNQVWMAENLNYPGLDGQPTIGRCYEDQPIHCTTYGRLYTWAEAMAGSWSSGALPSGVQGLCPDGSHLPSPGEWNILFSALGTSMGMALPLMANSSLWTAGPGTDTLGFSALPGGRYDMGSPSVYNFRGNYAYWWTSSEGVDPAQAITWRIDGNQRYLQNSDEYKDYANSIRCIVDP